MNLFGTKVRGLATVAVLLAVATAVVVGTGLASGWMAFGPPDPQTASREAILRWLVIGDVAVQPRGWQLLLVERFEHELDGGLELSNDIVLTVGQRTTLTKNVATLKHLWFVDAVEQYRQLSRQQQANFMDARVATVLAWSELEQAFSDEVAVIEDASLAGFCDEIQQWVRQETDSQLRSAMEQAVEDGVVRWLAHYSLEEQPMNVRTELATRIAEQLEAGLNVGNLTRPAPTEAEQLRRNAEFLMEAWLLEQARLFEDCPATKRSTFIAERIDNVTEWGLLELFADDNAQKPEQQGAMKLMALSRTWIDRAPETERPKLRQLLAAVQSQMLLRMLNGG